MATEAAQASENIEESPDIEAVRGLLRLLVKAQKAKRLYDEKNAVSDRLEKDLFARLSAHLEGSGDVYLQVLEFQLKSDDAVVYESQNRNDSLAFLLYRDGVRRLSFHQGLEPAELEAFLRCLNRVALLSNDQDDLVTLFWEQDFHSIRYFAIEELSETDSYPRLGEQLATGEASGGAHGGGAEAVSLDLEQPVSTIPVEACRLNDEEIEALRAELASEEQISFQHLVAELAIELTLLDDDDDERRKLPEQLISIADTLIAAGDLAEVVAMQEHLEGLASMAFPHEPAVQELVSSFLESFSERERLATFLGQADTLHALKPEALTAHLVRFGSLVDTTLVEWMGKFSSSAYRRAATNALLASEDGGIGELSKNLPLGPPPADSQESLRHRQFVREVVHALSKHPAETSLPLLERLLSAADRETRRESFVAISRYPEPRVEELSLERLNDPDPEIRATALDTLVRRGKAELGVKVLERSLEADAFEAKSINEKRRVFAAVAKLSGESALEPLRELLLGKESRWFASRKDREFAEAVAHGIRMVGTDRARQLLRECAENGARFVRAACEKELTLHRG